MDSAKFISNEELLCQSLDKLDIKFIAGVPDSTLGSLSAHFDRLNGATHIIAANEGSALALAIGNNIATKRVPLVYLQNSGIGNLLNPLTSLADGQIFSIPAILVIGWRGEIMEDGSQKLDEPQHSKQGQITLELLKVLGITCYVLDKKSDISSIFSSAKISAKESSSPVAILVRRGVFGAIKPTDNNIDSVEFTRKRAIKTLLKNMEEHSVLVGTTGFASRELFEEMGSISSKLYNRNIRLVGGMGHAASVASGICDGAPSRKVYCIDGDGAALMHLGSLAHVSKSSNIIHCIVNNGIHESVGGVKHCGPGVSFEKLAKELGYSDAITARNEYEFTSALRIAARSMLSTCIEVVVTPGYDSNLGRPNESPLQNKQNIQEYLNAS